MTYVRRTSSVRATVMLPASLYYRMPQTKKKMGPFCSYDAGGGRSVVAGIRVDPYGLLIYSLSFLKDQTISTYLNLVSKAGEHVQRHTRCTPFYTASFIRFMTGLV